MITTMCLMRWMSAGESGVVPAVIAVPGAYDPDDVPPDGVTACLDDPQDVTASAMTIITSHT
jgi:hypothetical protein